VSIGIHDRERAGGVGLRNRIGSDQIVAGGVGVGAADGQRRRCDDRRSNHVANGQLPRRQFVEQGRGIAGRSLGKRSLLVR